MNVLVVDDHPLIHEALTTLLPRLDRAVSIVKAENAAQAREAVQSSDTLNLILLDLSLPDESGMTTLESLREMAPQIPVVILSAHEGRDVVTSCIEAGAMGFIPKTSKPEVLLSALQLVVQGGVYLPPTLLLQTPRPPVGMPAAPLTARDQPALRPQDIGLTQRQGEVLSLLVQGKPTKLICRKLGIAEGTAKIHISAIFKALNVSNRTEAVFATSRLGLVLDSPQP